MPPRWLSVSIILFWLGTTGWLFYQDVWPLLLPGQAPPFTIDLEDEVQTRQAHIHWSVLYNDRPYLRAETWVEPDPADDTFALKATLRPLAPAAKGRDIDAEPFGGLVRLLRSTSTYRIARNGDLRSLSVEFTVEAHAGGLVAAGDGVLDGEVKDGKFHSRLRLSSPVLPGGTVEKELDPVPVSAHGSVLSPLHPVNRIAGLRPGQTWRLPLVDPIKDAVTALVAGQPGTEIVLTARVLSQTQTLTWNNEPTECLIIEYQGDDVSARTWVQVGTGLVLRQDSERDGERLSLVRE